MILCLHQVEFEYIIDGYEQWGPFLRRVAKVAGKSRPAAKNNKWRIAMIRSRVREWAERHALLPQGSNIVAACSGGPDSLALVDLLDGLRQDLHFNLFIAHFDHGLRGEDSTRDADFVRQFCESRKLPFRSGGADVKGEVRRGGGSIEEVSRLLRYRFLYQTAAEIGEALIATGHHRDDQAETVLLNLLRGSGERGLRAMRPRQGGIVRPLLCVTRAEIEIYCCSRNLQPRTDATNSNIDFKRNRVRHELIPLLRQQYNPALTETLCRTAEILADDHEFLGSYVERLASQCAVRENAGYRFNADVFSQLHVAVQRELLLILLEKVRGTLKGISFSHVEQLRQLFQQDRGAHRIDLPGHLQARKSYKDCFIERRTASESVEACCPRGLALDVELACPGETTVAEFRSDFRCSVHSGDLLQTGDLGTDKAAFDLAALQLPLTLRGRRPGDLFQPMGAPGARKLKKLLIDLKVPVEERDAVPILCDATGIVWVVGWRRAQRGKILPGTQNYILIERVKFASSR